jgi:colicin import membrane protein
MKPSSFLGTGSSLSAHSAPAGMILLSFALHFVAISLMFFLPNLSSTRIYYSPVTSVRLVSPPPMVDLGRETPVSKASPEAPAVAPPPPSPAKAKEKPISLAPIPVEKEETEKKIHEAIDRIRRKKEMKQIDAAIDRIRTEREAQQIDSAIDRIRSEKEAQQLSAAIEKIRKRATIGTAGAIETGDAASSGASSGVLSIKHKMYYNLIWQRIRSVWVLPEEALRGQKNLETIIAIRIGRDGQIESFQFEKKSGNPQLDESALRAIKKANPLPPLPPGIEEEKFDLGIRFKPSDLTG